MTKDAKESASAPTVACSAWLGPKMWTGLLRRGEYRRAGKVISLQSKYVFRRAILELGYRLEKIRFVVRVNIVKQKIRFAQFRILFFNRSYVTPYLLKFGLHLGSWCAAINHPIKLLQAFVEAAHIRVGPKKEAEPQP